MHVTLNQARRRNQAVKNMRATTFLLGRPTLLGAYSATGSYDYTKQVEPIPFDKERMSAIITDKAALRSAIKANEAYIPRMVGYYNTRIDRIWSPGKKARLRGERNDLKAEALAAIAQANTAILQIVAAEVAKADAVLPDYNPNTTMPPIDPQTGKTPPAGYIVSDSGKVYRPSASGTDQSKLMKWGLMGAAGLAAFMMLKHT